MNCETHVVPFSVDSMIGVSRPLTTSRRVLQARRPTRASSLDFDLIDAMTCSPNDTSGSGARLLVALNEFGVDI